MSNREYFLVNDIWYQDSEPLSCMIFNAVFIVVYKRRSIGIVV